MMKKVSFIMLSLILLLIVPVQSFAYKNENKLSVNVSPKDMPDGTAFVDLLVKLDDNSKYYSSLNEPKITDLDNNEISISENGEIVTYNQDGYMSFLFHFKDSAVDSNIDYHSFAFNNLDLIQKCKNVKVAFVDSNGKILKVTDIAFLTHFAFAETDSVLVENEEAHAMLTVYPLIAVACLVPVLLFLCGVIVMIVRVEAKKQKSK